MTANADGICGDSSCVTSPETSSVSRVGQRRRIAIPQRSCAFRWSDHAPGQASTSRLSRPKDPMRTLRWAGIAALSVKLLLALFTTGTNDSITRDRDVAVLRSAGAVELYRHGVQYMTSAGNPGPRQAGGNRMSTHRDIEWIRIRHAGVEPIGAQLRVVG